MSDTSPRDQAALLWNHRREAAKPPPRARELVFEFVRGVDHVRFRCELVDDGPFGLDVQILRNEELFYSRRCPDRPFAEHFATQERLALERYDPNDPI